MEDKNKKLEYLFLKTVLKSFLAFWDGFLFWISFDRKKTGISRSRVNSFKK
ncbi:hypothetical protein HMPREF9108_00867 [Leptotrichia sp. oral taxon 225 str. F0581]|nr:hypothetical protein HMPREF9108_00867 [Leptotrichia sp. oral taxon 225 str. F0581]